MIAPILTSPPHHSRSTRSCTGQTNGWRPISKWRVPIIITSLGARDDLNRTVHDWGGITLHDVIDDRFAQKAVEKRADGHAGRLSPFALIQEIRQWFDGPLALSVLIATGDAVLAARAMSADLAYIGSPFIATTEADANPAYKAEIVRAKAADIVYSSLFTGVHGNYLRQSIIAAGMDPDNLPEGDLNTMILVGRGQQGQGLEGHLGCWPGHRRRRLDRNGRRKDRPLGGGVWSRPHTLVRRP